MAKQLKICSFNCHSFVTNAEIVVELLDLCDILLLQETFLLDDSIVESHIGKKFSYSCSPAETSGHSGRPKRGLLVIWHSYLDEYVKCSKYDSRLMSVELLSMYDEYFLTHMRHMKTVLLNPTINIYLFCLASMT